MSIKAMSVFTVFLIGIQMFIVGLVTRANKEIFDVHKATSYAKAVSELAKIKPVSAAVIRLCYAACLFEVVVLCVVKYLK